MKYSHEVIIDLPREKVIEIFSDPDNAFKWMDGLESWEMVSGTRGEEGARSRMLFKTKRGVLEMEEEIKRKDLPDLINFVFTSKGITNWNDNRFESTADNRTKWVQSNVFRCKGMVKVFAIVMPGAFKKQSLKHMHDFKEFAEKNGRSTTSE